MMMKVIVLINIVLRILLMIVLILVGFFICKIKFNKINKKKFIKKDRCREYILKLIILYMKKIKYYKLI